MNAQDSLENAPTLVIAPKGPDSPMVTINRDGSVEFGVDYDIDEAARLFWEAIAVRMPGHLRA